MYVKLSLLTSDLSAIQAAAHIHRYLTLDESILLESSADSAKGDYDLSLSLSLSLSGLYVNIITGEYSSTLDDNPA